MKFSIKCPKCGGSCETVLGREVCQSCGKTYIVECGYLYDVEKGQFIDTRE